MGQDGEVIELPREILDGEGLRLREPRESDADDIAAACQDPLTQQFVTALPDPYSRQDALFWVRENVPASWRAGGAVFVVVEPEADRLLGCIGINRAVAERRQGEVGYFVAPWGRGQGVARRAARLITSWAFHHGFGRMELLTDPENGPSQRVALAAGYQYEGLRRGAGIARGTQPGAPGERHDLLVWTRLAGDPVNPVRRLLPDLPGGELTDHVVTLRPVRAADAEDVFAIFSLDDVIATSVPPQPPEWKHTAAWCARAESRWLTGERLDLTIRDARSGAFAGEISLYYQEPVTRQAMLGYSLMPRWRGRGYTSRAVRLLMEWTFGRTRIQRVVAGTAPDNLASQRVLERVGFVREGLLRRRLPTRDGGRSDDVLYGLLPTDLADPPSI